jgi:hypothetical protein
VSVFICILWIGLCTVPILSPRIPPFVGYLLCQFSRGLNGKDFDPCQLNVEFDVKKIFYFRNMTVVYLFRIIGALVSVVIYTPAVTNCSLLTAYEVMLNVVFQSKCLARFKEETRNASLRNLNETVGKYRQLQILNDRFNKIYSRDFFATVMASVVPIIVSSGYFLITTYHVNPIILIFGAFVTAMEYTVIMIIFIMSSRVWNGSAEVKWTWRKNPRLTSLRIARRYGTSLRNLRINIGTSNFVERNTPFVFFSFCIDQTISLVLLQTN